MQTTYTAQFAITAQTAWDTWYAFSDRACHDTATAYRWYCQAFFSAQAQHRYQVIGEAVGHLLIACYLYWQILCLWAESEVVACIEQPAEVVEVEAITADPLPAIAPAIEPAPIVAPAKVAKPKLKTAKKPSVASLRKQCSAAGIRWRGVKPNGKHLSQDEMIVALEGAAAAA